MPLKNCSDGGKPGYKWGDAGHCYTYTKDNPASQKSAKKKAIRQGIAIEGPDKFKKEVTKSAEEIKETDKVVEDIKHYQDQADEVPPPHEVHPDKDNIDNFTLIELVREVEREDSLEQMKSHLR